MQELGMYTFLWVVAGGTIAYIAAGQGRSLIGWGAFGFLCPVLAGLCLWLTSPPADRAPLESTKDCPFCAELVKAAAIKCKHCGSDIPT